jgi:predicted MPP superfamily phosphohydrolase
MAMAAHKQPVTVLHLTDLHFGCEAKNSHGRSSGLDERKNRLRKLTESLGKLAKQQPDWRPQVVAITGDIGWKGIDDDYQLAKEWLDELLQQLGLSYSQVVVCAGNHDINRVAVDRITVPTSAETADSYLQADISDDDLRGFKAFTSFCESAGIAAYRLAGENKNWLVGQTELAGLTFIALNSAWYCRGDNDRGNLWVGRLHLEHLISGNLIVNASVAQQPIIALVHHPPTWWHDAETNAWNGRPNVMDMLARHSHLVLTGHTHGEVRKHDRIAGAAYHLTGGSAYASSSHSNSVRLIRVE